jgi:hypothetical protein
MRAVAAIAFTLAVLATPAHAQAPRQQPQQQKPLIFNGNVFDPPPQAQAPSTGEDCGSTKSRAPRQKAPWCVIGSDPRRRGVEG